MTHDRATRRRAPSPPATTTSAQFATRVRLLTSGSFWLTVRHKSPIHTGEYRVQIKTRRD